MTVFECPVFRIESVTENVAVSAFTCLARSCLRHSKPVTTVQTEIVLLNVNEVRRCRLFSFGICHHYSELVCPLTTLFLAILPLLREKNEMAVLRRPRNEATLIVLL